MFPNAVPFQPATIFGIAVRAGTRETRGLSKPDGFKEVRECWRAAGSFARVAARLFTVAGGRQLQAASGKPL